MLKLNPIKPNMTEIETNKCRVLFSYKTPVAYIHYGFNNTWAYKTDKKWSKTTTKHINQWINNINFEFVDQSVLDNLL